MAKTSEASNGRLNPFAFPVETDVRFVLFMVAILALALSLGELTSLVLNPNQPVPYSTNSAFSAVPGQADVFEQNLASNQQLVNDAVNALMFPIGLTFVIFTLAIILYLLHPKLLSRQKKLIPLQKEKDHFFYRQTQSLAHMVRVVPAPTVMIGKGLNSQNGQAFGLPQHFFMRLDGGLRLLLRKKPEAFRAIVLHELAHIANRDIGRTYFAQALWSATILLVLLPLSISMGVVFTLSFIGKALDNTLDLSRLITVTLPTILFIFVQLGVIVAIIAAIRAGLLRTRELYADGRAALWGAATSLLALLERNKNPSNIAQLFAWWRLHPTTQERQSALHNPAYLFQISMDLPFAVGFLFAIVAGEFIFLSGVILPGFLGVGEILSTLTAMTASTVQHIPLLFWPLMRLSQILLAASNLAVPILGLIIILSLAYVVSNTVGLAAQRQAIADLIENGSGCARYLQMGLTAALMIMGIETAFLIAPDLGLGIIFASDPVAFFSSKGLVLVLLTFVEFVSATIVAWLWIVYARFLGQKVFGSHTGARPPTWKRRFLTLAVSGVLIVLFLPIALLHIIILGVGMNPILFDWGIILQVFVAMFGVLFLYILIFGMSWISIKIYRGIWPPRCPKCRQATFKNNILGQSCGHCGHELSLWLFVPTNHNTVTSQ
jgi:Zn-dependent protease with chaperone function